MRPLHDLSLVAGAVTAEAGQPLPGGDGWLEPADWLPGGERLVLPVDIEEAGELVGTGLGSEQSA